MQSISSIFIDNFRGLRDFRMEGAQMFNLLVGPSEIGKTTVLEAIELTSFGELGGVNFLNQLRGARIENERDVIVAAASFFHNFRPTPISMEITTIPNDAFGGMLFKMEVVPVKGNDVISHNGARGTKITNPFLTGLDQFNGLKCSAEISGAVIAKGHKFMHPQGRDMLSEEYKMEQNIAHAGEAGGGALLSQEEINNIRWASYLVRHPMPAVAVNMAMVNKKKDAVIEILRMINPHIKNIATIGDTAYIDIGLEQMVILVTVIEMCP